ncbi:hypothetical protein [Deinococcus hopiensis]|uniref:Uncharacterized protein n=1 Tax=Deinococcus hopiensis KR-140 TaxID=695939 RepID=A0A1W1VH64_9DEIO|nr:hypothetical protein [Deinococcus hopiensis]SMB92698.1 hypothetical protein SAMN00790413_01690 [Deinococcus hopiensis KR-140]
MIAATGALTSVPELTFNPQTLDSAGNVYSKDDQTLCRVAPNGTRRVLLESGAVNAYSTEVIGVDAADSNSLRVKSFDAGLIKVNLTTGERQNVSFGAVYSLTDAALQAGGGVMALLTNYNTSTWEAALSEVNRAPFSVSSALCQSVKGVYVRPTGTPLGPWAAVTLLYIAPSGLKAPPSPQF